MYVLCALCGIAVLVSFLTDRKRTKKAFVLALNKMKRIALPLALMIVISAVVTPLLDRLGAWDLLSNTNHAPAALSALGVGSVAVLPGAVAFPLGAVLLEKGVANITVAMFTTSLMTVGIATFPVERMYLGTKLALARNVVGIMVACMVALGIGAAFGELGWP